MENLTESLQNPYGVGLFFLLGMVTSLHCVCMCGPISMIVLQSTKSIKHLFAYHGSRLISYTWLGVLFGFFNLQISNAGFQRVFLVLLILLLIVFALGKTAWIMRPLLQLQNKLMEKTKLWSNTNKTIILGLFTPLLPCGPLYAAFTASIFAPNPIESGMWMSFFALGTIPLLFLQQTGLAKLTEKLRPFQKPYFYRWMAILVIGFLAWHYIQ